MKEEKTEQIEKEIQGNISPFAIKVRVLQSYELGLFMEKGIMISCISFFNLFCFLLFSSFILPFL